MSGAPRLIVGPQLRYVDETSATVWIETDTPCTAEVRCAGGPTASSRTFTVHGHHYTLVVLEGLRPGGSYEYTVHAGGHRLWPEPDHDLPASRIRTFDPDRPFRLVFGSCHTTAPHDPAHVRIHGVDMLRAYALRMAERHEPEWPSLLLLLGDQVYADEPPPDTVEFDTTTHRHQAPELGQEVDDFDEYAELYRLTWAEPVLRWLLSTTPTAMIFDDHELRDDWNISASWQQEMAAQQWWRRQATAGVAAYWIYQHLGNLSPAELAEDSQLAKVRAAGGDAGEVMDEFAWEAGTRPKRYRWSYARDYGRIRLVVLDSRCARDFTGGQRAMVDADEWAWFQRHATGDLDQLLIASSLPVLLPQGIHEFESWNEAVCDGAWGARAARAGEKLRRAIDLDHWGAYRASFDALAATVREVAAGARGSPPASVVFLSGDVHYSYLAKARLPAAHAPVYQAVCSPIRNPLSRNIRLLNGLGSTPLARLLGRALARSAGVGKPSFGWAIRRRPIYQNAVATLDVTGRELTLRFHGADGADGAGGADGADGAGDDPARTKVVTRDRLV